ncbi:MAG: hypothetical protein ABJM26_18355 [Anderseniella sp.]
MQAITFCSKLKPGQEFDVFVVLTILALAALGIVTAASVFMTGFTGEPFVRIAAKVTPFLLLIFIVLYFYQ